MDERPKKDKIMISLYCNEYDLNKNTFAFLILASFFGKAKVHLSII